MAEDAIEAKEEKVRLGGMALANGVLVHGPTSWAVAVRTEDGDVKVVVGGIIPDEDAQELKRQGVAAVFQPGASLEAIVSFIREAVGAEPHYKPQINADQRG